MATGTGDSIEFDAKVKVELIPKREGKVITPDRYAELQAGQIDRFMHAHHSYEWGTVTAPGVIQWWPNERFARAVSFHHSEKLVVRDKWESLARDAE